MTTRSEHASPSYTWTRPRYLERVICRLPNADVAATQWELLNRSARLGHEQYLACAHGLGAHGLNGSCRFTIAGEERCLWCRGCELGLKGGRQLYAEAIGAKLDVVVVAHLLLLMGPEALVVDVTSVCAAEVGKKRFAPSNMQRRVLFGNAQARQADGIGLQPADHEDLAPWRRILRDLNLIDDKLIFVNDNLSHDASPGS